MYHATVLFVVAASVLARGVDLHVSLPARFRSIFTHPATLPLALAALLVAQHAYLAWILDASFHQTPNLAFFGRMPVRIVNGFNGPVHIGDWYGTRFLLLALGESIALGAIYLGMKRPQRWQIALVACAALAACADAALARAGTSADMYSYVGFSLLGKLAYAPPNAPFAAEYSVINAWWGRPMVPAPYGPFWLLVAGSVAAAGTTLFAKIVALRLLGAVALAGVVAALVAMRTPTRIVALLALNPALVLEFVANVHNDLFAIALLLFARLAASRKALPLAIVFAALAALVKLPFLLFAALSFAPIERRDVRLAAFATTALVALAVSWFWGGPSYLAALHHHVNEHTASGHAIEVVTDPYVTLKIVAAIGLALALFGNVWFEGFGWALATIGAAFFPWYLSWTIAYAVERHTMLRNFAIALPIVTLATDDALGNGPLVMAIEIAFYCALAFACVYLVRTRRRPARAAVSR